MKTYVFLTGGIEGINGVVIYLHNKIKYLINKGYQVRIFHPNSGEVYVHSLEEFSACKQYMKFYPCSYRKNTLERYLDDLVKACGDYTPENTVIETHSYNLSCWGEVLAQKMRCKHIHLLVTENPIILTDEFYDFMRFKLDRYELFGMNEKTIPMLLKEHISLGISEKYQLRTPCDNTVQNIPAPQLKQLDQNADFHICTVGRLDKPYIMPMVHNVSEFCKKHKVYVQIVFIGDAYHKENIKKIKEQLSSDPYVSYIITGFLYPIPLKLLHSMDMAIGCAGSVLTTYYSGLPTVPLDVTDFDPIGIFGITTNKTHYKEKGQAVLSLDEWMTKILLEKNFYKKYNIPLYGDLASDFDDHFKKIAVSDNNNEYYNVSNVVNEGGAYRRRIIIMRFIGPKNYVRLDKIKQRLKYFFAERDISF